MNEKVILPRFDLPRDSTNVAMRALWATGGDFSRVPRVVGGSGLEAEIKQFGEKAREKREKGKGKRGEHT